MQTDNNVLICETFHTRAELRSPLSDLKNVMKNMPNVKCASTGTRMRYSIREINKQEAREVILELAPREINFMFYLKEPNIQDHKHNLLRFLSILAYLKDVYTINMRDMYAYVIEALRYDNYTSTRETSNTIYPSNERMDALNDVNVSLSHELSLKNECIKKTDKQLAICLSFSKEIIQKLSPRNNNASSNYGEFLNVAGIDKNLASEILSLISEDTDSAKKWRST